MKRFTCILIFLLFPCISFGAKLSPHTILLQSTGANSRVQFLPAASGVLARSLRIWAHGDNASDICYGEATVNGTGYACIKKSAVVIKQYIHGHRYDLTSMYVHFISAGDTGVITYW